MTACSPPSPQSTGRTRQSLPLPISRRFRRKYYDSKPWFSDRGQSSLANDFYEDALPSSSVEFAVENLFPGTKVQFPIGYGDDDFPAHDLPFEMRVRVVCACTVVMVWAERLVRSPPRARDLVIVDEVVLHVGYEYLSGLVHCVH